MSVPTAPWSIAYRDGSANAYHVTADDNVVTFEYRPVTPERSSTGMYSGGPPREGRLDAAQVAELWTMVRALESATELHAVDRMKGTGAFQLTDQVGTRDFIILRGPALLAFDELVQAF
jgi:hypothetical protein